MTLSLADTLGIAKYITYIQRYTHTRAQKKQKTPKKEKNRKRRCHDNQHTTVSHFGENK